MRLTRPSYLGNNARSKNEHGTTRRFEQFISHMYMSIYRSCLSGFMFLGFASEASNMSEKTPSLQSILFEQIFHIIHCHRTRSNQKTSPSPPKTRPPTTPNKHPPWQFSKLSERNQSFEISGKMGKPRYG